MAGSYAKFYIQLFKKLPNCVPKRLHQPSFLSCFRFRGLRPGTPCAVCSEVTQGAPQAPSPVLPLLWGQARCLQGFCWGTF